jgi:hypothetical protein
MNKRDLFIAAMKNGNYRKLAWVINAFSIAQKDKLEPDLYSIYRTDKDLLYTNKDSELEKITDVKDISKPLYYAREPLTLNPGDLPNVTETIQTSYGIALANCVCVVYPFIDKIPYLNEHNFLNKLVGIVIAKLKPTPDNLSAKTKDYFYIDEYLKLTEATDYLTGFSKLFITGLTPKLISPPPGIDEFKKKLYAEYKDKMGDPLVAAIIDKKLTDYAKEYLKNDPGMNFFSSKKQTDIVYKKMFLSLGAEPGLGGDPTKVDYIEASLSDGWDIKKLPSMNNSMRKGSYSRGANTEIGGVRVKWLLRSTSGFILNSDDCGTNLGITLKITEDNVKRLVGFKLIGKNQQLKINNIQEANAYIGKKVMVRSPQYCKQIDTGFCKCCIGDRLSINPTGLGAAAGEIGSTIMLISMSSAHSKGLTTTNVDLSKAFT